MAKKKPGNLKKGSGPKLGQAPKAAGKPPWPRLPAVLAPPKDEFLGWLGLAGIVALSFLMSFHTLVDTDIFWHLRTGQIIWDTHRVPQKDLFSFTMAGKEWIDAQWLFQAILYPLYRSAGYTGIILFGSVLTALTWILILAPGFNPRKYFSVILIGLIALLSLSERLRLRPEILTFFYIALEIYLLDRFRRGKKYALYPLPLLLLLWVNSEGLWPVGFFILGAFLGEEILFLPALKLGKYFPRTAPAPARGAAARLLICLLIGMALTLVNPYGVRGALFPTRRPSPKRRQRISRSRRARGPPSGPS